MSLDARVPILLVDDRAENLLTLETVLKEPRYELVRASSGQEALEKLAQREYALVLLDVQMPDMDGFETARRIKLYPASRQPPIIFITAVNKELVHVFRGYKFGAIDYVLKPFDDDILRAKVAVIVDLFQKTAQLQKREQELSQLNAQLSQEIRERKRLEDEIMTVSEREQQRIGQDLHDGLCQQLMGLALSCKMLAWQVGKKAPEEAEKIARFSDTITQIITETRELVKGLLYPAMLESGDLAMALYELASVTEIQTAIACQVEVQGPIILQDRAVALHLYRIAQEAVTNAVKHSKAAHILIKVDGRDEASGLRLVITDDGIGLPKDKRCSQSGMGLRIMRHRANMIGASFQVDRASRGGTTVVCWLAAATSAPRGNPVEVLAVSA
jgi:signal transduction histidine kinase